jgi:hypothetical protein
MAVCRISDLIESGLLPLHKICNDMTKINKDVWGSITEAQYVWTEQMLQSQFKICPNLIFCAFNDGKMVATLTSIHTTETEIERKSTWLEKAGNGYLTTHIPTGNVAFGIDLSVLKGAPKKISDRILLSAIFMGVLGGGLKSAYLGARIPSYYKYKDMKVEDYVYGKRKNGKPLDPELYFYIKDGFEIVEIIPEYMDDPDSLNYGVLIKWDNPIYKLTKALPFLKPIICWIGEKVLLRLPS